MTILHWIILWQYIIFYKVNICYDFSFLYFKTKNHGTTCGTVEMLQHLCLDYIITHRLSVQSWKSKLKNKTHTAAEWRVKGQETEVSSSHNNSFLKKEHFSILCIYISPVFVFYCRERRCLGRHVSFKNIYPIQYIF